ncbi:hypothetical protein, partial [Staphylococcus nepalensis]|uniref:hypothetical protein n=1 Tax=Staphylococcus nepalensis TaxID=214473 RepID=UPI00286E523C
MPHCWCARGNQDSRGTENIVERLPLKKINNNISFLIPEKKKKERKEILWSWKDSYWRAMLV